MLGRNGEDESIPDLELMIGHEIKGGLEGAPCGIQNLKGIGPSKDGLTGCRGGIAVLGDKDAVQLPEGLRGQACDTLRKALDERSGSLAASVISESLRVGEDVGVESDLH